ncbi:MAG TPA: DoxX family protein [Vicinamibacterales bacterium]|jgi:putative oxidoreductase|nr:DoxX family protein [Vicinamibacterales bacterium]
MRALHVLGRTIFGSYFVYNGINHLVHERMLSQYAAAKGVSNADVAVPASGALLITGGLSLVTGFQPRRGLLAIIGFLVPVTLEMHRFWAADDPAQRSADQVNFLKNVALIGAALALFGIDEPWPVSVDEARPNREDMYVHLGGREMPALPA